MNRTLHTNDVIPRIAREVERINSDGSLPPGVKVVPFYDRTTLVNVTTHTVLHNLIFGCLLVFVIQWVFLGDLRSAIIVGVNIPFALFFSIIILVLMNEDANLLSVGAVDFGIIVNSAVILVENMFRNFQARPEQRQALLQNLAEERWGPDPTKTGAAGGGHASPWTDRMRLILISAMEVDTAVFFSAAITVAAFVPLFTMQGVEGQIFNPMARTYGFALAGALFATFTITPVLASILLPEHIEETETIVVRALRRIYSPALHLSLTHRKLMVGFGIGFLIFTALLAPRLGTEFLPALEEGNLWIRASMPPTISLDAAMPSVTRMREILMSHPEIITVVSQHGRPDNGSDASAFYNVEFFVPLKPFDEWPAGQTKEKLVDEVQKQFAAEFPGVTFNFSQYIQDNIEEGLSGVKGANSIKIVGPDLDKLEEIATKVLAEMDQVRGVADLGVFRVLGQPNLNIKVDREKAARYGLNTGDVNAVVQAALGGTIATTDAGGRTPVQPDGPARAGIPQQISRRSATSRSLIRRRRDQRLHPPERACRHLARHRRLLHLSRTQASASSRSSSPCAAATSAARSPRRRSASPRTSQLAERLPHRMGRRVRRAPAGEEAARDRGADHPAAHPRAALRSVQFDARQPAGACRHPVRDRWRHLRATIAGLDFSDLGGDRLHLAVRRRR